MGLFRKKPARDGDIRLREPDAAGAVSSGFRCSCCGDWHPEIPLAFHAPAPLPWSQSMEGAPGYELSSDMCVINDAEFYVRGLIRVPIRDDDRHFEWGVWVSLSEHNFDRTVEMWTTPGRESSEPMFGWLATALPTFDQPTAGLKTMVHTRPVGLRPLVEVESTDHPLSVEQRSGLTVDALTRRVERLLHPD